jgi:regulator of sirC expression with transglutaminase-like and TPR domain
MPLSEARRRFAAIVRQSPGDFRLAEATLLIAQEEYPGLDVTHYLQRLDVMAEAVRNSLGIELDPRRIVASINTYLFDEMGFHGNQTHYYDPRNSFLNEVLDRKTGLPITLAVIYLDLGRQVGLPTVGVGLPGHFIVQYAAQSAPLWIDPFHRGEILTHADCVARVRQIYGEETAWDEAYLQPVSDHAILQRLLYNLKAIYAQQRDFERTLSVVERLLLLSPEAASEVRDRGLLHYQLGHFAAALDDLQHYLQLALDAPDAAAIRRHIAALRRQIDR